MEASEENIKEKMNALMFKFRIKKKNHSSFGLSSAKHNKIAYNQNIR